MTPRRCPLEKAFEIYIPPPGSSLRVSVAKLQMNNVMARAAKGHEIVRRTLAALRDGDNVMHLIHRGQSAFLLAAFTKWVLLDVPVAYTFPRTTIGSVEVRAAGVFVVGFICFLLMLGAVQTVCQLWAAGICARALWLVWHSYSSSGA